MRILEELFHKSRDGAIISAAVQSWTLLLSIAPDHVIPSLFKRSVATPTKYQPLQGIGQPYRCERVDLVDYS